jgi:hypothetical protein
MIYDGASIDTMMAHVRSVAKTVNADTLLTKFKINDYILTGTIVMKNHYTNLFAGRET